ncbi:MAG: zinc ribbon domain-containing protein [Thermoproteota archaeon]|nr:zinc ribbon domain-containing protein [Thermoproteota archaeon]
MDKDETIFLVLEANVTIPDAKQQSWPRSILLFTNEKLIITRGAASILFDSAFLNTLTLNNQELKKIIQQHTEWLIKTRSSFFYTNKIFAYPIDYDKIYDLRMPTVLLPRINFKRRDRPPSNDYSIMVEQLGLPLKDYVKLHKYFRTSHRMWGFNLVMVKKRGYPLKPEIKGRLLKKGLSLDDKSLRNLVYSKLCLDALRRVPKERKQIISILSKLRERGERYLAEITVTKESFSQLKCQNCGAGQFEKSAVQYKTSEGKYNLLKCKYCGFEGLILKHGVSYKVAFPESPKHAKEEGKETFIFCRFCGAKNLSDAIFCQKCGKKLGQPTEFEKP